MCLCFSIIRWYANHIFLNANHPGWPPQPPWSPWPPDHQDHQDQLDHFGFPNPQQQFAKFANILSWVCKQVFSNDNLQKKSPERHIAKKCLEQELAKKVFQTTNLQKRCPEQPDQPDKFAFLPDYIGVLVSNPVLSALLVIQSHNQQPLFSSSWRKWNQSGRKKREGVCTNWF